MTGAFSKNAFKSVCSGARPWLKDRDESCREHKRTVQRGGSNVYFPIIASSITIPPFTNKLFEKIKQTDIWKALITAEGILEGDDIKEKFFARRE